MISKICTSCGHMGNAKHQSIGVFLVDVLVWALSLYVILHTHLLLLLLPPAVWSIYHISTFRTECPHCHSNSMVTLESSKGKSIFERSYHRLT